MAANLIVVAFGPASAAPVAFVLIGLDLSSRDALHERWRGVGLVWRMGLLILAGSALAVLVNPASGRIAGASCLAFFCTATTDTVVYHLLSGFVVMARINGSNVASAAVDSIVFPTVAFGALMPRVSAMQFVAKVGGGFLWSLLIRRWVR